MPEMFSTVLIGTQKATNKFQDIERLTKAHRKEMNDLVDAVNSQIVGFPMMLFSG
jgi:hypothetical protein